MHRLSESASRREILFRRVHGPGARLQDYILYYWLYDGGEVGCAVLDTRGKKWLAADLFADLQALQLFLTQLESRLESQAAYPALSQNQLRLPGGLGAYRVFWANALPDREHADATPYLNALLQMLDACGTDLAARGEMLRLTTGIWSGYLARALVDCGSEKYIPPLRCRAPVLSIPPADSAWYTLEKVALSLVVNTVDDDPKGMPVLLHNPPVLPSDITHRRMEDSAFLQCYSPERKHPSPPMPTQYRDTAVLLHGDALSPGQIKDFISRNRWCATLCYAYPVTDAIRLHAKLLARASLVWDTALVQHLSGAFVSYLAQEVQSADLQKLAVEAEAVLRDYHEKPTLPRVKPQDLFWTKLQLLSVQAFLQFCLRKRQLSEARYAVLLPLWYNLLLPGCRPLPETAANPDGPCEASPVHYLALLQTVLQRLLTSPHLSHFLSVPPKGLFPLSPAGGGDPYWGYCRTYQNKKSHATFPAVLLREHTFHAVAADFLPVACDLYAVLKYVRKIEKPSWLHPTPNAYMPQTEGDQKRVGALILNLQELTFLEQDVRDALIRQCR